MTFITFATIVATILLSIFSTAVLSYLSLALSLGPWIDPTVVLIATLFMSLAGGAVAVTARKKALTLITAGASLGGILAVGCGFAWPTIYFVNPELFNSWLARPAFFAALLGTLTFIAGSVALMLVNYFQEQLLVTDKMAFPVGRMAYKMIEVQDSARQSCELAIGFCTTLAYSAFISLTNFFGTSVTLIKACKLFSCCAIPAVRILLLEAPLLWSIGFVTGHVIAIPLAIGILTKIFICTPAYSAYFTHLKMEEFTLAFCSGLVLYGTVVSFLNVLQTFFKDAAQNTKGFRERFAGQRLHDSNGLWGRCKRVGAQAGFAEILIGLGGGIILLSYYQFGLLAQLFVIAGVALSAYQLLLIAGKVGIAPVGRFATFVMVPGLFLFGFTPLQATVASTLVEVCGGIAVDAMFGRTMAMLAGVERSEVRAYQWLGLVVSSLCIGGIFWLLINHFTLGSVDLLAQRAQSRAVLMNVRSFDVFALVLGALYGSFLKELKVNATLVLGGILMSLDYSLLLTLGGLSTFLVKDPERQYPFWSGMFAAGSLWMVVRAALIG